MQKATIQLETLTCPSCMLKIEGAVKSIDGVDKAVSYTHLNKCIIWSFHFKK